MKATAQRLACLAAVLLVTTVAWPASAQPDPGQIGNSHHISVGRPIAGRLGVPFGDALVILMDTGRSVDQPLPAGVPSVGETGTLSFGGTVDVLHVLNCEQPPQRVSLGNDYCLCAVATDDCDVPLGTVNPENGDVTFTSCWSGAGDGCLPEDGLDLVSCTNGPGHLDLQLLVSYTASQTSDTHLYLGIRDVTTDTLIVSDVYPVPSGGPGLQAFPWPSTVRLENDHSYVVQLTGLAEAPANGNSAPKGRLGPGETENYLLLVPHVEHAGDDVILWREGDQGYEPLTCD